MILKTEYILYIDKHGRLQLVKAEKLFKVIPFNAEFWSVNRHQPGERGECGHYIRLPENILGDQSLEYHSEIWGLIVQYGMILEYYGRMMEIV